MDGHLALADPLQTATIVRLAAILSTDEALRDLGTFTFVTLHLFSAGRRQSSDVAELLRLIEKSEETHTEVQGMISSLHPATTIIYDVSWRWILYLNRCVDASALEALEAPGVNIPFTLDPILLKLEGGRYVVPVLPGPLSDLIAGRRPGVDSAEGSSSRGNGNDDGRKGGGGGGGVAATVTKVEASGGVRVRVRYDVHLPAMTWKNSTVAGFHHYLNIPFINRNNLA